MTRRGFGRSAAATALLAGGLRARRSRADTGGGTVVVGHVSLRHLNPAIQSGNATGVPGNQIFAGLVRLDDKFAPQPYLAKHGRSRPTSWPTPSTSSRTVCFTTAIR